MADDVMEVAQQRRPNGGLFYAVSGIAALATVFSGIAAITRPIEGKIESLEARLERIESRTLRSIQELDTKLQIEIAAQSRLAASQLESSAEFRKDAEDRRVLLESKIDSRADRNATAIGAVELKIGILEERIRQVGER